MNVGLPNYCTVGKYIWCTISPLICFHIIEWHRPDRVLRQFRFRQGIPQPCDNESILHKCDLRVDMMLIGLFDMETTFDIGALSVSILLEARWL
ncbi:hypothetical protein VitviT2T_005142 [Vitis vinifera]|uniref:Aminotransferase-like plant mobile domain-containing protein n=1 Tax=Vitis vinifera TaxID=29760 RepID=A0ABY9BRP0_VITVI|nr:hypothetical protein VitviT2T_005142 [Vitis vinifera]